MLPGAHDRCVILDLPNAYLGPEPQIADRADQFLGQRQPSIGAIRLIPACLHLIDQGEHFVERPLTDGVPYQKSLALSSLSAL